MALAAAACGGARAGSAPAATARAPSALGASGVPAAAYDIKTKSGGRLAEIDVFARGVYHVGDQTYLGVALAVRDVAGGSVELEPALLGAEVFTADGATAIAPLSGLDPDGAGNRRVAKGTTREFHVTFTAPHGLAPEDVNGFRLRWGVRGPDGNRTVQFTFFTPDHAGTAPAAGIAFAPTYGWYDPSLYEPTAARVIVRQHQPVRQVVVVPSRLR